MAVGPPDDVSALYQGSGRTPVPDPTLLTTAALTREIASLKEVIFTRLDAMDKAVSLFTESITRVPTDTDKQIQHLKEFVLERMEGIVNQGVSGAALQNERFAAVQRQFGERDIRTGNAAQESKSAVEYALQAAKEAVAEQNRSSGLAISKSEASTAKQIEQLTDAMREGFKGVDGKIDDAKERLTRLEGRGEGGKIVHDAGRATIAVIISAAALVLAVILAMWKRG